MKRLLMIVMAVVIGGGAVYLWRQGPTENTDGTNLIGQTDFELPSIGFAKVVADYTWQFPQDYGPHPDFQREQWQIKTTNDCPTPLTITFARVSVFPQNFPSIRSSAWATRSIITADVQQADTTTSRVSRAVIGLAGSDEQQIWVDDWEWQWATGRLVVGPFDWMLNLGDPLEATSDNAWHRYTRIGQADNGCLIELIHQFGT